MRVVSSFSSNLSGFHINVAQILDKHLDKQSMADQFITLKEQKGWTHLYIYIYNTLYILKGRKEAYFPKCQSISLTSSVMKHLRCTWVSIQSLERLRHLCQNYGWLHVKRQVQVTLALQIINVTHRMPEAKIRVFVKSKYKQKSQQKVTRSTVVS